MILFFDVETTGLPKNGNYKAPASDIDTWPRIVQIAWAYYDERGNLISKQEHTIKPEGFPIPSKSTEIHGITTEYAMEYGKNIKEILKDFSYVINQSLILVAHNVSFDSKVVGAEFIRAGMVDILFDKESLCTKEESTEFCKLPQTRGGYKWPSLSELHLKLFNKEFEDAHNAMADVEACSKCFWELNRLGVFNVNEMLFQLKDDSLIIKDVMDHFNKKYSDSCELTHIKIRKINGKKQLSVGIRQKGYNKNIL